MIPNETRLWRAVIKQAAQDAFGYGSSSIEKDEAIQWFCDKPADSFRFVCDMAGLESDYIRANFLNVFSKKEMRNLSNFYKRIT